MPSSFGLDSTRVRIAGIVGYDLFRRAVVEVELKAPADEDISPLISELPTPPGSRSVWTNGLPAVLCTLAGGREEWFAIDTGAAMTVIFLPWLAKESGTRAAGVKPQRPLPANRPARLPRSRADLRSLVRASSHRGRSFPEDRWLGGALGRWLLWDYRLVFDYRHERVAMIRQSSQKRAGRG